MENKFENIKLVYEAYRAVREKLAMETETYLLNTLGNNEYFIDDDNVLEYSDVDTNTCYCGRVKSIKKENNRIYVNAEYLHDIPFRNLSTTDKVMVVKAFINDFGSED